MQLVQGHWASERQSLGLNWGLSEWKCMLGNRGGSMGGSPAGPLPVSPLAAELIPSTTHLEMATLPLPLQCPGVSEPLPGVQSMDSVPGAVPDGSHLP